MAVEANFLLVVAFLLQTSINLQVVEVFEAHAADFAEAVGGMSENSKQTYWSSPIGKPHFQR